MQVDIEIDETPKKFDRVIAILTQLQSKRIVKAQELAKRFGVSLRTIYRDIKTLENSGVPITSEAGVGYSIVEGYKLPPVMFTRDEALSFAAAEKLVTQFTDKSLGDAFRSAMYKIKSILRWTEKDWINGLDEKILVQPGRQLFNEDVPNALEILMYGIGNKKQVRVFYQSSESQARTERTIEPVGLYHENGYWYLMAYCHLRKGHRKFRTDRIFKIAGLDTSFELQHQDLSFYLKKTEPDEKIKVTLLVDNSVARHIELTRKYYGFISETQKGDQKEMHFLYADNPLFMVRWLIMFADKVDIVAPESLKYQLKNLVLTINKRMEQTIK